MDVVLKELIKIQNGWKTVFSVHFPPEELSKIENSNDRLLKYFKEYSISKKDNIFTLARNFKITEPWEDETHEAVVKSVQLEIEYLFRKII